jgi:hypothetical protein
MNILSTEMLRELVTPASELGSTARFERAKRREKETGRFLPAQESVTRVYTLTTKHENGSLRR